ncbi:MAG: cobalamin biosynthesis protein [Desulfocapsaceae bacterium]|nr:cobalamin biosynthesis protein [Desulfocapsaceae bacterium]
MKTAVIALTNGGNVLAERISAALDGCVHCHPQEGVTAEIARLWSQADGLICVMAAGIVVRAIAPLCTDKKTDPCVIVLDEKGEYVISLLSGHLGGGNALARKVALITGGRAVITTASDVTGHTAIDLWIAANGLTVAYPEMLTSTSARLVNEGGLGVFSDLAIGGLPWDLHIQKKIDQAAIVISPFFPDTYNQLWLIPRNLFIGFGCNRGTTIAEFESALDDLSRMHHLDRRAIAGLASIDLKNDEEGLLEFAEKLLLPIRFFSKNELNTVTGISTSPAVLKATGAKGVAEPSAVLAAAVQGASGRLLIRKMKWKNVTAAVAAQAIHLKE